MSFLEDNLADRYSINLINVLYATLQPDENRRPNFIELEKVLGGQY